MGKQIVRPTLGELRGMLSDLRAASMDATKAVGGEWNEEAVLTSAKEIQKVLDWFTAAAKERTKAMNQRVEAVENARLEKIAALKRRIRELEVD